MNAKAIITAVLLLFVGGSVAYLVVDESRQKRISAEVSERIIDEPGLEQAPAEAPVCIVDESRQCPMPAEASEPIADDPSPEPAPAEVSEHMAAQENPTASVEGNDAPAARQPQHRVIAYYFHGTRRCNTCRKIEAFTDESLQTGFPEELKAGKLEWRVVNVEEPGNEHFVREYELSTRTVILVDSLDGVQERWKNLSRVWELVGDKQAFAAYIRDETESYLGEHGE